ncbi:NUDIX hydrolase domain-like protein [Dichotomopilus funicola]|uniref:NUDIX hydrolase domain-like protein n=1 Tax=Dichotomopilus funicola TaxID=1934379 RepID=A0AAN6ZMQ3_9PEZI|nr:NUDIX hydrolase domain-like protein [Dichotomopilus funicola]
MPAATTETVVEVIPTKPLIIGQGDWIRVVEKEYKDPNGNIRTWESAERVTRPEGCDIDGVSVVAIVENDNRPEVVLQKQYRPALERVVIELPAGLVDEGETPEQAAIRELEEETGYVAKVEDISPVMFNDPGFCNTNLRMVHVTLDMDRVENKDPKPKPKEDEFIEVFRVPLADLWDECVKFEAKGYAIDAGVASLAEGIKIATKFNL